MVLIVDFYLIIKLHLVKGIVSLSLPLFLQLLYNPPTSSQYTSSLLYRSHIYARTSFKGIVVNLQMYALILHPKKINIKAKQTNSLLQVLDSMILLHSSAFEIFSGHCFPSSIEVKGHLIVLHFLTLSYHESMWKRWSLQKYLQLAHKKLIKTCTASM